MKPTFSIVLAASMILISSLAIAAEPTTAPPKQITNSIGRCQTRPIGLW